MENEVLEKKKNDLQVFNNGSAPNVLRNSRDVLIGYNTIFFSQLNAQFTRWDNYIKEQP